MASLYFDSRELYHFLLDNNGDFEVYDKGDEYGIYIEAGSNNQSLIDFLKLFNEGVESFDIDSDMINFEGLIITATQERKEFMSNEEAEALEQELWSFI